MPVGRIHPLTCRPFGSMFGFFAPAGIIGWYWKYLLLPGVHPLEKALTISGKENKWFRLPDNRGRIDTYGRLSGKDYSISVANGHE
jgi:hypothetical protein